MSKTYDDLETFFRERGLKQSGTGHWFEDSYDYGVWWLDEQRRAYRLTWLGPVHRDDPSRAGELYLVRLDGPHIVKDRQMTIVQAGEARGHIELLCVIPPHPEDKNDRICADHNAEKVLEGWAEACGGINSVEWVRQRARQAISGGLASEP